MPVLGCPAGMDTLSDSGAVLACLLFPPVSCLLRLQGSRGLDNFNEAPVPSVSCSQHTSRRGNALGPATASGEQSSIVPSATAQHLVLGSIYIHSYTQIPRVLVLFRFYCANYVRAAVME